MKGNSLVGILVSNNKAREGILRIYQGNNELDIKLFAFTRSGIIWSKGKIRGLGIRGDNFLETEYPFPDAVYNRLYNKRRNLIPRLERKIGPNCFNVVNFFNKWDVYKILKKSPLSIHLPDTFSYSKVDAVQLLEKYKQVYLKAYYGNKGRQVYRIELLSNGDVEIAAQSLISMKFGHKSILQKRLDEIVGEKRFILQEGIQMSKINKQQFDIRALVQKDITGHWKISTVACRMSFEYFSNTSSFKSIYDAEELFPKLFPGNLKYNVLLGSVKGLSVTAAQVLDTDMGLLGEISVDFGVDIYGKLWIIEVNGKPQKSLFKRIKDFKYEELIYSRPLEFAYFLSNTRPRKQ